VKLDPQLFEAYYYLGRVYFAQGKFDQAVDAFKQACAIRPDDVSATTLLTTTLKSAGRKDEAMESTRHSVKVAERYLSLNPDDALALSRGANDLIHMGDHTKALKWAERAYAINPKVCRYNVACVFVLTGNIERALDLLEEHAHAGALHADWVVQDSDWDAARDHPRFKAIIDRLRTE
jgi:adenylate cyclase